jgi:ABC-type lipoprotein release transport system permease subunit
MYIRLAWRNLWRNKRRTLITSASVFFAVFFAIAMRSMQLGSYDNMVDNVVRFYSGYAQIHQKGYWDEQTLENSFEQNDSLNAIAAQNKRIESLIPRLETGMLASNELRSRGVWVIGIDPEKEKPLTDIPGKITSGSYFAADDKSVIVTSDLARYLKITAGDTLVLLGQGYHAANAAGKYHVSGIVKFKSPELNKRFVFLPLSEMQWLVDAPGRLTSQVVMTGAESVGPVVKFLRSEIDTSYEVMDWKTLVPEVVQAIEADNVGGIIVLGLLYIIIGFGIFGTVLMMTAERRHEFGVLIALGMKRFQILTVLAFEGVFLTLMGVAAGTAVSLPFIAYLHFHPIPLSDELKAVSEAYGVEAVLPFSVAPEIFGYQALTVLIIALLSMTYPLYRIMSIQPSQAMRA